MDSVIAWIGAAGMLLGVLTAWSTWDRRRMRRIIIDTQLELGIVKYHRRGGHEEPEWGDHENLPDAIVDITTRLKALESHHESEATHNA